MQRVDHRLRQEILAILAGANDMTIATVRQDGYPQATAVSYVNDDLTIYFGCAAESQKAENIARRDKVSLTVNLPYSGKTPLSFRDGFSGPGRNSHQHRPSR